MRDVIDGGPSPQPSPRTRGEGDEVLSSSNLPLPRWVHIPGETAEPDKEALARAKALVPPRFDAFVPFDHPALRYGFALNDAGFFWEAHEILEAVWQAAPKGGRDRILLRACIQIANAGLKHRLGRARAVARLLTDARTELRELVARAPKPSFPGSAAERFPVARVAGQLAAIGEGVSSVMPSLKHA